MANELPYFRFYPSAWQNGKIAIESKALQGLFINICAFYWIQDCSIAITMLEKKFSNDLTGVKALLEEGILKTSEDGEFLVISFLDEQFDLLSDKRKRRQDAGRKGGKQKSSNAKAMLKQKSSYKEKKRIDKDKNNIPPAEYFSFEKSLLNYGFEKKLIEEWLQIRKKKKLVNSETAYHGFIREVEKTGAPKNDVLKKCVERSWGGFESKWLNENNTNGSTTNTGFTPQGSKRHPVPETFDGFTGLT